MEIHSIIHYESLLYFRQYVPINMPFIGIFSARFCLPPSYPLSARLSFSVCVSYFSILFSLYITPKLSLCMHMSLFHSYTTFSIRLNLAFLPRDRSIFFNMYYDSGPWFNIKMTCYQYRKSHCGDKTILRPSYLHNGISYTGKTTYLYWIVALMLKPEYPRRIIAIIFLLLASPSRYWPRYCMRNTWVLVLHGEWFHLPMSSQKWTMIEN